MIAGERRPHRTEEVLHIDYKVVLDQAVENARIAALREAVQMVKSVRPVENYGSGAADFKANAIHALEQLLP